MKKQQTIHRIVKRDNPYVQIDKTPINDPSLSWRAKGVLLYLLSKPHDWIIRVEDILNHACEGRDAVRKAMNELRQARYAELQSTRDGKIWIIHELPQPEKPSVAKSAQPEKPTPEKPTPENPLHSNNELTNNDLTNNEDIDLFADTSKPNVSVNEQKKKHPDINEVRDFALEIGLHESDGEYMFNKWEADEWMRGKKPLKNWKANLRQWKAGGYLPSQKPASKFQNGNTPTPTLKHIPTAKETREARGLTT